jgi:hypothetical protein
LGLAADNVAGWACHPGQCSNLMRTDVDQLVRELPVAGITHASRLGDDIVGVAVREKLYGRDFGPWRS